MGLPAPRPARCVGMQEPEPREAPGWGSGDPPVTAQCWRGDRTAEAPRGAGKRCAAAGFRAGRELTWVRGAALPGEGAGSPLGRPPPPQRPDSAASLEKLHLVFAEGGGSWGGWPLPRPAPARSAEPRLRAPASRRLQSPPQDCTSLESLGPAWHHWSGSHIPGGRRGRGRPSNPVHRVGSSAPRLP